MDDEDDPLTVDFRIQEHAERWAEGAELKPGRVELRERIATVVKASVAAPMRVLELGSGPGWLAEVIGRTCEVESYTLFDFARPMHEMARKRLGEDARFRYVLGDFKADERWTEQVGGPFDAVVTMQAVHELRHKRHTQRLYEQVRNVLRPEGLLLVCDHEPKDDARSQKLSATSAEQREALTRAGYTDVDVQPAEYGKYICTARNPTS